MTVTAGLQIYLLKTAEKVTMQNFHYFFHKIIRIKKKKYNPEGRPVCQQVREKAKGRRRLKIIERCI